MQKRRPLAEINVVPYIDVMLVLLVIFMITAPLFNQGVNVKLPEANAKTLPPQAEMPIIISIDQAGYYFLNVSPHPAQALSAQELITAVTNALHLAKQRHQVEHVYIKGDRSVNYGKVVQLMVLLQHVAVNDIALVTENQNK